MGKLEIGKRIRKFRLAAGLTQAELAKKIGTTPSAIGMYENGRREPSFDTLEDIAIALGVTTQRLTVSEEALLSQIGAEAWKQGKGDLNAAIRWQEVYDSFGAPIHATDKDIDYLEALHQNPKLGMLFERQRNLSADQIEQVLRFTNFVLSEREENNDE